MPSCTCFVLFRWWMSSLKRKTSPPSWHSSSEFVEGTLILIFASLKVFYLCSKGVLVRTLDRSKPLGFCLVLILPIDVPKVFWFSPWIGRSRPWFSALLSLLICRRCFGSDLWWVEAPWPWFSTYCAFICAEGVSVQTFGRSKPLGFCLALIMPLFAPKVFWFGPWIGRSPLALV